MLIVSITQRNGRHTWDSAQSPLWFTVATVFLSSSIYAQCYRTSLQVLQARYERVVPAYALIRMRQEAQNTRRQSTTRHEPRKQRTHTHTKHTHQSTLTALALGTDRRMTPDSIFQSIPCVIYTRVGFVSLCMSGVAKPFSQNNLIDFLLFCRDYISGECNLSSPYGLADRTYIVQPHAYLSDKRHAKGTYPVLHLPQYSTPSEFTTTSGDLFCCAHLHPGREVLQ